MEMETAEMDEIPIGTSTGFGYTSEYAIFSMPERNLSTEKTSIYEVGPNTPLRLDAPIEFHLSSASQRYINLRDMKLYLRLMVEHTDGTPLEDKERVGLVNYPIAALFQQVDLFMQQGLVCSSGNCYPYKSMIDVLLENDKDDINGFLRQGLFYKDTHNAMEETFTDAAEAEAANSTINAGFLERAKYSARSNIFEIMGKLHVDLCRQERYIINAVQLTLRLIQSRDQFRLMRADAPSGQTAKECRVKILTATLRVPLMKPVDAILLSHANTLYKGGPSLYPFERTEIKTYSVPAGEYQVKIENVFFSRLPKRIVVAMVESEAFIGAYNKNPFNFQNFSVNYLCFMIDGVCVPSRALMPEFSKNMYLEAYDTIFNMAQDYNPGIPRKTSSITRDEYKDSHTLYCFSLDGSSIGDEHVGQQTVGISKLDIKFENKLKVGATVILYATFPAVLRIDDDRNIRVDG